MPESDEHKEVSAGELYILQQMNEKLRKALEELETENQGLRRRVLPLANPTPGAIYRVVYSDAFQPQASGLLLYLGRLKFDLTSVLTVDGKIRKLKPEHIRHYSIEVGLATSHHLIPISGNDPPHPNIGWYICLGDLDLNGWDNIGGYTDMELRAFWRRNVKRIVATLSTANLTNCFRHEDKEYFSNPDLYEGDSPVFSVCNYCGATGVDVCNICGNCTEHCDGVRCSACGEFVHSYCDDCLQCDDCGCACHDTTVCEGCGEVYGDEYMHSCGFCDACHDDLGHSYCEHCGEHLTEVEIMPCSLCERCCQARGHTHGEETEEEAETPDTVWHN